MSTMTELSRVTAWLGAARGIDSAWYVVEIGGTDPRGEWNSEIFEGAYDGNDGDAACAGLVIALSTLAEPTRVGVAVTDRRVAKALRTLVTKTVMTKPHVVSITCVSVTAEYAATAVECARRARELAAGTEEVSGR
jgi:hypothetical protein